MTGAEYEAIWKQVIRDHLAAMWIEDERVYRCPTCGWQVEDEFGATNGYNETVALLTDSWTCYHDVSSAWHLIGYALGDPIPCTRAAAYNDTLLELWRVFDKGGDGDEEAGDR